MRPTTSKPGTAPSSARCCRSLAAPQAQLAKLTRGQRRKAGAARARRHSRPPACLGGEGKPAKPETKASKRGARKILTWLSLEGRGGRRSTCGHSGQE